MSLVPLLESERITSTPLYRLVYNTYTCIYMYIHVYLVMDSLYLHYSQNGELLGNKIDFKVHVHVCTCN